MLYILFIPRTLLELYVRAEMSGKLLLNYCNSRSARPPPPTQKSVFLGLSFVRFNSNPYSIALSSAGYVNMCRFNIYV